MNDLDPKGLTQSPATFTCDESEVGPLYYFAPANRAPGPYKTQRRVEAILDIASDGTLAGVELIDNMPPAPSHLSAVPDGEGEAFGTAWQTSYTGDEWHFAREASFSPSDIERGIVKNVTPLFAASRLSQAGERDAEVQRLTEENEALRKGKTDIALTALAADGQAQEAYEKLCAAEARIKALEEALREDQEPAIEHIETLVELLKIIKEHWIDYDHVFSISVQEADDFLAHWRALQKEEDAALSGDTL